MSKEDFMRETLPLSARTTLVGLIGWPIGHSVSPAMHNAAFAAMGTLLLGMGQRMTWLPARTWNPPQRTRA